MPLLRWGTRTKNILGQLILTFVIHSITMVGQAIHAGAAINGPKEAFLAMVWTHFESFVGGAIVSIFGNFTTCMSVPVWSARLCLIQQILSRRLGSKFI